MPLISKLEKKKLKTKNNRTLAKVTAYSRIDLMQQF